MINPLDEKRLKHINHLFCSVLSEIDANEAGGGPRTHHFQQPQTQQ